ncbi:hypothetical protein ACMX2H_15180 [Arthrobacter sulfonylureivorans]|uniref:hypothetical protein n=1 Tax=Arthrobacter sulfonylureivorans TaxID=2486855 RepID=UPI0039E3F9F0
MSVSVLLIPAAIAAVAAVNAAIDNKAKNNETNKAAEVEAVPQVQVRTRMRDLNLLQDALADTQAEVVRVEEDSLEAAWTDATAVFNRDSEGIWQVHFSGEDVDRPRAAEIVQAIDEAYARRVQQAVVRKLRERAHTAGLELASETVEEDQSVTMVLNVRR